MTTTMMMMMMMDKTRLVACESKREKKIKGPEPGDTGGG
jgi:hypothetical protein